MATPIIPLQPYIPTGEGEGAAYILPNTERVSATDIFRGEIDEARARRLAQEKVVQDAILGVGKLGGKGLPGHRRQFADKHSETLKWFGEQRGLGKNPGSPGTSEYLDLMDKMNKQSATGTIMGEIYDNYTKDLAMVSKNPNAYESEEWLNAMKDYENLPIDDANLANFPHPEPVLDIEKYKTEVLKNIPESETLINERADPMVANQFLYDIVGSKDPEMAARNAMNTQTKKGQRFTRMMKEMAANDPATLETALMQSPEYNKNLATATKNNNGKPLSSQQIEDVKVATAQDKKAYDNILNKAAELKAVEEFSAFKQYNKGSKITTERQPYGGGGGKPNEKKAIPFVKTVTPENIATENPDDPMSKLYNTIVLGTKSSDPAAAARAKAALAEVKKAKYEQNGISLGTTKMYSDDGSTMIESAQNLTYNAPTNEYQIQGSSTEGSGRFKNTVSKISAVDKGALDELASTIARRENITKDEALKKMNDMRDKSEAAYKGMYKQIEKALATASGKPSTYPGNKPATPATKPANKWDAAKRKK